MRSLINKKLFVGKTIQALDTRACNVLGIVFTDGTRIDLEVEGLGGGLYGIVTSTNQPHHPRAVS